MASRLPSFYSVGNATVADGGTTVTGTGTLWQGRIWDGDMFGTHVGNGIRILSVDSDTQLTLAHPWPGPSQTAAPYEIGITPDTARMQETTRELLQMLANGNLAALAGVSPEPGQEAIPAFSGPGAAELLALSGIGKLLLNTQGTPAANKLPFLSSDTAAGLLDLSTFMQPLLNSADAAALRNAIGAQPAAYALSTDSTTSWNDITDPGWWPRLLGTTNTGAPISGQYFYCLNIKYASTNQNFVQVAFPYRRTGKGIWYRLMENGTWTAWRNLDAESGSNANGYWLRLGDMLLCGKNDFKLAYLNASVYQETWTFPVAFAEEPVKMGTIREFNPWPMNPPGYLAMRSSQSTTGCSVQFWSSSLPSSFVDASANLFAFGRA